MAELAEVETFRKELRNKICGQKIRKVWIRGSSLVFRDFPKRKQLPNMVEGKVIMAVGRRCKYLLIGIDRNLTLVIHPGMTGNLFLRERIAKRDRHCHMELYFRNFKLTFRDHRMFGRIFVLRNKEFTCFPGFAFLGPEPLSKEFNENWLYEKLSTRRAPVKALLLDQKIACGVGNIYADEACFIARISPLRQGRDLKHQDIERLVRAIKYVLKEAIKRGGTTIRDYRNPNGKLGANRPLVYGRFGKGCLTCGEKIYRTKVGNRTTFYCPACQQ